MAGLRLFGFEITRKKELDPRNNISFAPPQDTDGGSLAYAVGQAGASIVDFDGTIKTESGLIDRYREMSLQPEIDEAINEILNAAICYTPQDKIVNINLSDIEELDEQIKDVIRIEFENVLKFLEFSKNAYNIFRTWYVDGRIYFHVIIDDKNTIKEFRYIDPRKLRKVKEVKDVPVEGASIQGQKPTVPKIVNEYFVYSEKGFTGNTGGSYTFSTSLNALRIAKDSILYCTSGLNDKTGQMVLSHLHKAIKPLNQLRALEDAVVIYRMSRSPERRVFYVDIGNLPKSQAEQYLRDMMVKHKNKLVYNPSTGEIRDDRRFQTIVEDYWIPRRSDGQSTKIDTLPGAQNLGVMDDVKYFQEKLYDALNIPKSRLESGQPFTTGTATEITLEEVKFYKFINRLRMRFSDIFIQALEKVLIINKVIKYEEWLTIKDRIRFDFTSDNHFNEFNENMVLKERLNMLEMIQPFVGSYFSMEYVKKNILKLSEEEIARMNVENEQNMGNLEPTPENNPQIELNK